MPYMYPATLAVVLCGFYAFAPHMVAAYLTFSIAALTVAGAFFAKSWTRYGISFQKASLITLSLVLLDYPAWFALAQANMEIVVWVLLAGGVALFLKGKDYPASVCFGLAASMKIYPLLFLVLPLLRRHYRQVSLGVVSAAIFSVSAVFFVGPTFSEASNGIQQGLDLFRRTYMLTIRNETGFDHSLFAVVKESTAAVFRHRATVWFGHELLVYLVLLTLITLALLFTRVWKLPEYNQVMFCTITCVLFPPTSFEYTLLQMMTVFGMLVLLTAKADSIGKNIPGLNTALLLSAVTQACLAEVMFKRHQFGGQLKCLALLALLFVVLRYRFELSESDPL